MTQNPIYIVLAVVIVSCSALGAFLWGESIHVLPLLVGATFVWHVVQRPVDGRFMMGAGLTSLLTAARDAFLVEGTLELTAGRPELVGLAIAFSVAGLPLTILGWRLWRSQRPAI